MTVVAADLIAPSGDITPAMFPDESTQSLPIRVQVYLDRSYVIAGEALPTVANSGTLDDAATQQAYYLLFTAVADRLAAQNASATLQGLGSIAIGSAQYKYFMERARLALQSYQMLTAPIQTSDVSPHPVSTHLCNVVQW